MELFGDDAGIQTSVKSGGPHERIKAKMNVLPNGTSFTQVEYFEVKDPETGENYFSTYYPNFGLPSGVERIVVRLAETHRIVSPVNESLSVKSEKDISLHGVEGTRIEGKDIVMMANGNVTLKSINGSVILEGQNGITVDVTNIPIATAVPNLKSAAQYKVCACMPQGKLFRIPVESTNRFPNCARISRTLENDPCL